MGKEFPLVSIIIVTWNEKEKVIRCLNSVREITYPSLEIIVVDNNSTDGTKEEIEKRFGEVVLVKNKVNLMAAGGRNTGINHVTGNFLFFLDCDNVVDKNAVTELVKIISQDMKNGIVGPKMYYYKDPERIWFAGATINLTTSKTAYFGINKLDSGQYERIQETGHFPNAFMVRKEVIDQIGGFDVDNFKMHYEESDFCLRAKRAGFKLLFVPAARVWHDVPLPSEIKNISRGFALDDKQRTYMTARNRILFMRKHAKWSSYTIFLLIFLPLFTSWYSLIIIRYGKTDILLSYLKGSLDGLFHRGINQVFGEN